MFTFEETGVVFVIYVDGKPIFEIVSWHDGDITDEDRGMVACMVDALNKESNERESVRRV